MLNRISKITQAQSVTQFSSPQPNFPNEGPSCAIVPLIDCKISVCQYHNALIADISQDFG
jgi:hypothetical protein